MDIPNLSQIPTPTTTPNKISFPILGVIIIIAIGLAFGATKLFPAKQSASSLSSSGDVSPIPGEDIKSASDVKVGQIFGDTNTAFSDSATGTIEKGSINGEGTHILNRDGGPSQRASLTSSVIDLDLFVGRKVEIKGQTNASKKTAWLLDVGWLKVLE